MCNTSFRAYNAILKVVDNENKAQNGNEVDLQVSAAPAVHKQPLNDHDREQPADLG